MDWRKRSVEMHRRAQKAEGELAKIKDDLLYSGKVSQGSDRKYYMLGWMVYHSRLLKLIFPPDS